MKKGFTLIELLAVIAVLAIIALIATPIVINIINESKKESQKRSVELYGKAVEQAIADYNIKYNNEAKNCKINENQELYCDNDQTKVVKINYKGSLVKCGVFQINNGQVGLSECSIDGKIVKNKDDKYYTYGTIIEYICKLVQKNLVSSPIGDKYECNVKMGQTNSYIFYILSENKDDKNNIVSYNLIMNNNICYDETKGSREATSSDQCRYAWHAGTDDNSYGPDTAMTVLYNATKGWNKISNIQINYEDEGHKEKSGIGYGKIETIGNESKIYKKDNTTVTVTFENLKARLPMKSELEKAGCTDSEGSCASWLIDNLASDKDSFENGKYKQNWDNKFNFTYGYWTISSSFNGGRALPVRNVGSASSHNASYYSNYGIRPVITVNNINLSK